MIIKVLGSGCPKCKKLEENVLRAIKISGVDAQVDKVTDLQAIMNYRVLSTPALVIDGVLKSTGRILSPNEIIELIKG